MRDFYEKASKINEDLNIKRIEKEKFIQSCREANFIEDKIKVYDEELLMLTQ